MKSILAALAMFAMTINPSTAADTSAVRYIKHFAAAYGIPYAVALAVSHVESGTRCNVGGRYLGPLQINYRSARGLGYKGTRSQLKRNCSDQVKYGMLHLRLAKRMAHGDINRMICKHQAGPGARCSGRNAYVRKVKRAMK